MKEKLKFKNLLLTSNNYKLLYIISFFIIIKIIAYLVLFIHLGFLDAFFSSSGAETKVLINPEGYLTFSESELPVKETGLDLKTLIYGGILLLSMFLSLIFRSQLSKGLNKDVYFHASNLNLKIYRILFLFHPILAIVKLISKSYNINRTFTTKELIKKWRIINSFRDTFGILFALMLVGIFVIVGTNSIYVISDHYSTNIIYNIMLSILVPTILVGGSIIVIISYPFMYISACSAELYNEIIVKENKQWKKSPYLFFASFPYIVAWSNVNNLAKEIKDREQESNDINITKHMLYLETIYKLIWHVFGFLSFILAFGVFYNQIVLFQYFDLNHLFFIILIVFFSIYLIRFIPNYISVFFLLDFKEPKIKLLYFIDLVIPIVSIRNILNYRKNKVIFGVKEV